MFMLHAYRPKRNCSDADEIQTDASACLSLLSEAGDACWGGILEAAHGLDHQQAIKIEAASWYFLAFLKPHWQGLTTDVRPAHLCCAMHYLAVQGDLVMATCACVRMWMSGCIMTAWTCICVKQADGM